MWLIFQGTIMFLVIASNIQGEWTPNPYAAAVVGIFCAAVATGLVSRLLERGQKADLLDRREAKAVDWE